jgi:hypothetical protein
MWRVWVWIWGMWRGVMSLLSLLLEEVLWRVDPLGLVLVVGLGVLMVASMVNCPTI